MNFGKFSQLVKAKATEFRTLLNAWIEGDRRRLGIIVVGTLVMLGYACSRGQEKMSYVYDGPSKKFSQARVIENPYKHIADSKMDIIEESEEKLRRESREIQRQISEMRKMLEDLKTNLQPKTSNSAIGEAGVTADDRDVNPSKPIEVVAEALPQGIDEVPISPGEVPRNAASSPAGRKKLTGRATGMGPASLSFPVAMKKTDKGSTIVVPSGSYVKAKIISGVKVPVGETYPASLQLDFAFIAPNNFKVDLSGCLIVAKAEADLSTERINMSPHSMRCYSAKRLVFKRDNLVGWASDSLDNNFGLKAEVNLNQGRLAQTAFAKSLLEGLGSSIERNSRSIGGKGIDDASPDLIIKDSGQKAGGMMTDYYMDYLKGLRPTLSVSSGRDAWIVLNTDVELPAEHFKTEEADESKPLSGSDAFN